MFILFLVIFLPLIEIIGFILIGGKIGAGSALLWVILDAIIGFTLLSTLAPRMLRKFEKSSAAPGTLPAEEMFEGVCIIVGALLLIFPGFISDFMALPLLIPFTRRWIFLYLKHKHANILNEMGKTSQGFTRYYKTGAAPANIIEGDFKNIDEDKRLS